MRIGHRPPIREKLGRSGGGCLAGGRRVQRGKEGEREYLEGSKGKDQEGVIEKRVGGGKDTETTGERKLWGQKKCKPLHEGNKFIKKSPRKNQNATSRKGEKGRQPEDIFWKFISLPRREGCILGKKKSPLTSSGRGCPSPAGGIEGSDHFRRKGEGGEQLEKKG